ncbi:serine hydrolase [Streptomyces sp. NPDC097610]|uniref:serine hydrolase n=1 Tax=Streptomyces sp. NPDC097610 TaxID=3157227 RepID=UPI00332669CA
MDHAPARVAMEAAVRAGVPGVLGRVRDAHGTWSAAVGVADLTTDRPRRPDDRFRIGSITKTFVSTVILQLEAERLIDLDDTVEH